MHFEHREHLDMLNFLDRGVTPRGGLHRRDDLRAGARSLVGLSMPGPLCAADRSRGQETERGKSRAKSTILSFLCGRASHVESGVPFVTVFWSEVGEVVAGKCLSGGVYITHGNNFNCLKFNLLPEFDGAFFALNEDLADRRMLGETLLLVTSEMGRTPKIGDPRLGGVGGAGASHSSNRSNKDHT